MPKPFLQLPARFTEPLSDDFVTDGDLLVPFVHAFMQTEESSGQPITLDEWQVWLLRRMLERYPNDHPNEALAGRLRYRQIVVSLGRQNGKSTLTQALALYGLLMHENGPTVIGLASSLDQAKIVYTRALYSVMANKWLKKRFKKATEHRGIHLADGSGTYMVKAAKESAVQGISVSLGIIDELHIIPEGLFSALTLGTSTRKDGLVVGITTAGDENSKTLIDLYKTGQKAVDQDPEFERFGFFCWEAPDQLQIDDPKAIYAANPAVAAGRVPIERVLSDVRTIPEHEARRYRLNQFINGGANSWLPNELLKKATGTGVSNMSGAVFAVDRTKNWEYATIAVANQNGDITETEIVASIVNPTEEILFNEIVRLATKFSARAIVADEQQFPNMAKRLRETGLPFWRLYTKEVSAACSTVYAMFSNNTIRHAGDPLLLKQSPGGVTKYSGESWLISRRDSIGDIDALMATLFAIYVSTIARHATVQVF